MNKNYLLKIYLSIISLCVGSLSSTAQNYNVTSTPVCNNVTGGNEIVNFTGATATAVGNGTVTMYFRGDFDGKVAGGEYMDLLGETGPILGTTTTSTTGISNTQCNVNYDSIVVPVTMNDLNTWAADGTISFTADAASGVNNALCYTPAVAFCVYMRLEYPRASGLNDIGVASLDTPSLFCAGAQNLWVTVQNYGLNQVNNCTVNWTWNGVTQTPINVTQLIDTAQGLSPNRIQVMLGTKTITDADTLVVWTSNPNNGADTTNVNDTLKRIVAPSLSGTYTINSAVATGGTNYQSFTALVNFVKQYGMCGPVVVNVTPGSGPYNEQVNIPSIVGMSATNTLTFNGNGATLTQNLTGTPASYATLNLDGADYVTVRNLNIEALGATYGFGVHLMSGADNNTFKNCTITANSTATGTGSMCVSMSGSASSYSATGVNGSNNTFDSCTLSGGYAGFMLYGSGSVSPIDSNNNITNCTIREYYVYGIYDYYQRSANRENNLMERPTRSSISTGYGVALSSCVNMLVQKNTIRNLFGGLPTTTNTAYPIYVSGDGTPGNENKIINNEIYNIQGDGTIGALYLTGADYIQVYNNTINIDYPSTMGVTYGIYETGTVGGIDIKNNNISITRGGTGVQQCLYYTGAGSKSSNNNNLYVNTATNRFVGATGTTTATQFATLAAWQAATGTGSPFDVNSTSVDPVFTSTTNLAPTNSALDNLGTSLPNVLDDINGVVRNASTPDIGAYEFSVPVCTSPPTPGDAVISPTVVCSGGTVQFNLSGNSVGIGQTYEWQSAATPAGPYTSVSGSQATAPYSTTVSATAYYRAAVTCGASTTYSDTILVTANGIFPGGTYTINSALPTGSGNFRSFNDAVLAIKCGISGPVVFNVNASSGPYVEQIDLPASIGSDITNTVTFNGNGRTIAAPTSGPLTSLATININGADYITFNNLNVEAMNSDGFGIHLMNGSDNNTFKKCTISASLTSTSSNSACVSMSGHPNSYSTTGVNGSNNSFDSCTTSGGYWGFVFYGSGATATMDSNNSITNCKVTEYYVYGTYDYYQRSAPRRKNLVERPTRATVSTGYGIALSTCINMLIEKNTVRNLFGAAPGNTSTSYPIYVAGDGTAGNENKIINNEIYNIQSGGTVGGLYLTGADYVQAYNNTIFIDGPSGTSYGIYATGTVGGIDIKNNNISIARAGGTHYGLYFSGAGAKSTNYNNIYVAPSATSYVGFITTAQATLANWQAATGAGSPYDANSVAVDPAFISPSNLRPTNPLMNDIGTPIGIVVDDITGALRNVATPDIGAYEFVPPTCPAPSNVTVSNPTNTTVDVGWTSNSAATMYQIEYKQGTSTFPLGTGTRVGPTSVTNPFTVTGLAPGTPYTFYVREICSATDTSLWSSAKTGFTAFPAIPTNDDCATPVNISNGALYYGTNAGATQTLAACDATPTTTDVWYTFTTGATAGVITDSVNTSFSGGDVVVQMFSGPCTSLTPMVPTGGTTFNATTGCVDGPAAGMEYSTYNVAANTTYFIRVYAYNTTTPGPFSIQITGAPLAIRLDKISATNVGASNRIDWNTLSEESSDWFELERSIDGKNFSRIHEREANGAASRYTYLDNSAAKGMNYYRLRMTAANGGATYSETVSAFVKSSGFEVEAFPNPVSHELTVKVSGVQGADATVQVTDVTGKVIKTVKMNAGIEAIDMSGLANGIYLIKYADADHTQTIKVNKQ